VSETLAYPNRIARALLLGTGKVLGTYGLDALLTQAGLQDYIQTPPPDTLDLAFPFAHVSALSSAMESWYGVRGGRGMAYRVGCAWLGEGLMQFGALAGVSDPSFVVLPRESRSALGLRALAEVFTHFSDQHSHVKESADSWRFEVEVSPFAYGRTSDRPVCATLAGLLHETLRWVSNGYDYSVQETACRAVHMGACAFTISKKPFA
jgi:hypothetical protein